jgi:hypothetical protein
LGGLRGRMSSAVPVNRCGGRSFFRSSLDDLIAEVELSAVLVTLPCLRFAFHLEGRGCLYESVNSLSPLARGWAVGFGEAEPP